MAGDEGRAGEKYEISTHTVSLLYREISCVYVQYLGHQHHTKKIILANRLFFHERGNASAIRADELRVEHPAPRAAQKWSTSEASSDVCCSVHRRSAGLKA